MWYSFMSSCLLISFRPFAKNTRIPLQCHDLCFSQMSSHSLIWFCLFDSKTGKQCEGTSASSILRSSLVLPFVDDFRKAVKAEHSSRLSSVDADELFVYRNKAAFENRNLPEDQGKEKPLDRLSFIDGLGENKNEALIVVAPSRTSSEGQLNNILTREYFYKVMADFDAILNHKQPKASIFDHATMGKMEFDRLKNDDLVIYVQPNEDEDAFWSEEIQIQANAISNEAVFTAFITPYFSQILQRYSLVFVNSEKYGWLPQSTNSASNKYLKPNGFATHRGMFRSKPVPNDQVLHQDGFLYGVAEEDLFDCLILFESTISITNEAFGQVIQYLDHLQPKGTASAILFDLHSFWLIKCYRSVVVKLEISQWADKGSKLLIENFIARNVSPWVSYLTNACNEFNVDVVEGDSFLGRGTFGRVFKVNQGGENFALKVAEQKLAGSLYTEQVFTMLAEYTGLTAIVVGKVIETPGSAALLLSPVGAPLPYPKKEEEVQSLFRHLWMIHEHNVVHGDARVSNVIVHEGKLLWIDFYGVRKIIPLMKRDDVEQLTRSILRISKHTKLEKELEKLIENYGESPSRENIERLAKKVNKHLQEKLPMLIRFGYFH
jgi:hypothetical protein